MKCPLAVYSWDWGRLAFLGYAGELFGRIRLRLHSALPCIVLHPCDASRNFLSLALAVIDCLLHDGFSPATFVEILAAASERKRNISLGNEYTVAKTNLCHHPGPQ